MHENKVEATKLKEAVQTVSSFGLSFIIAFFPKCPLCWAAYMSMLGTVGLSNIPYMKWLLPVLIAFLGLHLVLLIKKIKEKGYGPFVFSLLGAVLIIGDKIFLLNNKLLLYSGLIFILIGSLWNSLPLNYFRIFHNDYNKS